MHGLYKSQNDRKEFWEGEFRPKESQDVSSAGPFFLVFCFFQQEKGIMMGNDKITRG